jgi:hypothetical protein
MYRGYRAFVSGFIKKIICSSSSGAETQDYGRRDPSRWPHGTLYQQKVGTNIATSDGHSLCIVCAWAHRPQSLVSVLQHTRRTAIFSVFSAVVNTLS